MKFLNRCPNRGVRTPAPGMVWQRTALTAASPAAQSVGNAPTVLSGQWLCRLGPTIDTPFPQQTLHALLSDHSKGQVSTVSARRDTDRPARVDAQVYPPGRRYSTLRVKFRSRQ
jgi:hypothetical protein